jgi:uncharacterized protein YbjT (DUF2867 family)
MDRSERLILVTGATGYVGGRLVGRLLSAGYRVRCLARDPDRLQDRNWPGVEIVRGDVLDPSTLIPALEGVTDAYYLVHSMAAGPDFHEYDRRAAASFRDAAAAAGIGRIIYLGGLARLHPGLSRHLKSRLETGDVLRAGPVKVTEFRASVIVGSGSLSFELIRYLGERLPVMLAPRWVMTRCQPIGIRSVLNYLTACLERPESEGRIFEIGGEGVLTYGDMIAIYAQERGLRRRIIPVPILTPRLSSLWLGLVTPFPTAVARQIVDSLRNETICHDDSAQKIFPELHPMAYRDAIRLALRRFDANEVETSWAGAFSSAPKGIPPPVTLRDEEGMMVEERHQVVQAPPETVFGVVARIGGDEGWHYGNWLWEIRGLIDRMVGGVGLRRGRRSPVSLRVGDALDFWRVEAWEEPRIIRLRAEMKVPGEAWLQFTVEPRPDGRSVLTQKAFFAPQGVPGALYWYSLYPIHRAMFSGMIHVISKRAEAAALAAGGSSPATA